MHFIFIKFIRCVAEENWPQAENPIQLVSHISTLTSHPRMPLALCRSIQLWNTHVERPKHTHTQSHIVAHRHYNRTCDMRE